MTVDPLALAVNYEADWPARLRAKLYGKYAERTNMLFLADTIGAAAQVAEDIIQACFALLSIDNSEGAQLDVIGLIVGQPRAGDTDAVYRLRLRARIITNKSSGSFADLYAIAFALFGPVTVVSVKTVARATVIVTIVDALDAEEVAVTLDFLQDAKAGGVRLVLKTQAAPTAEMFSFQGGGGAGWNVGKWASAL